MMEPRWHYEEEESSAREPSTSRGRSSSRHQTATHADDVDNSIHVVSPQRGDRREPSASHTPRRRGNPQSSSPVVDSPRRQQQQQQCHPPIGVAASHSPQHRSTKTPLTPLSTLTALISSHADNAHTALQLYRQSHALHRHASERATLALEKLREAQAELEHAETARDFAREELERAALQKEEASGALSGMCKRVRVLSKGLVNRRVRLINLSKNAGWNGRLGTIVKLVTDGEDAGRWKVKLDPEWRGRDADGKRLHRMDTISDHDEHDDEEDGEQKNVVVAKAENLELAEEYVDESGNAGMGALFGARPQDEQRQRSKSRSRSASSRRGRTHNDIQMTKSRDPEEEEFDIHHLHSRPARDPSIESRRKAPPAKVSPDWSHRSWHHKDLTPTEHYRSQSGGYHESQSPSRRPRNGPIEYHSQTRQTGQSTSPSKARRPGPIKAHPARANTNNSGEKYSTPIRQSPSNDSARISSAFSRMMLSPVSFAPASFEPDPSDSFQRRASPDERGQRGGQRGGSGHQSGGNELGRSQPHRASSGEVSVAGSFFDEVTSLEKNHNEDDGHGEDGYYHERREGDRHGETSSDPQLETYPSRDEMALAEEKGLTAAKQLPMIVVLPVDDDDYDNPFLSPGYSPTSPPHCVGVQNAGISHVNGVYLLAHPKDEFSNPIIDEGESDAPPLYFRDGPPVILSDGRQYDMCILRINCPDSPDHVIWFLAKVDVDPSCLDVKFSDCYYYCRMLRNDDGHGGEREGGCQSPPARGWNVPKLPPGAEVLRIARSGSFSTEGGSRFGHGHPGQQGLGISPRPSAEDGADFVSPGVNSGFGSSHLMSKYSI